MNKLLITAIIFLIGGCKERYLSPVPNVATGYLVVEGVINNGGDETNIKLSRTTSLTENRTQNETGASVRVESSNNTTFFLTENSEGNYIINNIQLDTAQKYRLIITTSNNEEYISDYEPVRNNPPIDSINWVRQSDGVQIYINTHDPQNNTRYYQWDYNETWEFHSAYSASLKFVTDGPPSFNNIGVEYRVPGDPDIYACWKYNSSTSIMLGSSAKLAQDIIHLPLIFIENAAQQLSVRYSVMVNQYAWSKAGYEFLERMKKNTESVGSVFDPQPSELNGNIHCTSNPALPVIGFFNICAIQQKRIFIKNSELPQWGYRQPCMEQVFVNNPDSIKAQTGGLLPTRPDKIVGTGTIVTFYAAPSECVDCTLSGTNMKPFFWP
jgi:Domain of unknown function (DUF4249)